MGQTTSHNKNLRTEFLKSSTTNQPHNPNLQSFQSEDYNEDEEISCPTLISKSSYVCIIKTKKIIIINKSIFK